MQAWIDPDRCEGHTLCSKVAPRIFTFKKEDGRSYVTVTELSAEQLLLARTELSEKSRKPSSARFAIVLGRGLSAHAARLNDAQRPASRGRRNSTPPAS